MQDTETTYIDAFHEGTEAHENGSKQTDNPYEQGTEARDGWNDGWLDWMYS